MLLRLRRNLSRPELDAVLALARGLGYRERFLEGAGALTQIEGGGELLRLDGRGAPDHVARFEDLSGVAAILDAGDARERHQRAPGQPDTVVTVGEAQFGGGQLALIAGPCAVEDLERVLTIARGVRERGATVLRGGAYKPRTSPYSFQGSRERGLEMLARAKAETGLAIVTEVLDPRDIPVVSEVADILQVGSRNMSNQALLTELGRTRRPVLLKRGFAATLREFLLAAEYILAGGNTQVILCERGIRGFDPSTRNVFDVGAVAVLKRQTHLPVIVDPSHSAGRPDIVRALARAGVVAGADGVMCDVNPWPAEAHCDGHQAISFEEFAAIAADTRTLARLDGRSVRQATQPTETAS
jgi:3-deoxy-7-phosphoheptulonate synthase